MYTLFSGFYLNNAIFFLFNELGFTLLPFAAMLMRNVYVARAQGQDEGPPALLAQKWSEMEFIVMLIIMVTFVMPSSGSEIHLIKPVNYTNNSCSTSPDNSDPNTNNNVSDADYNAHLSTVDASYNGIEPQIPLGIMIAHNWASGAAYAISNSIPCPDNIQITKLRIAEVSIGDAAVNKVGSDFMAQCYKPAYITTMDSENVPKHDLVTVGINGSMIKPHYINSTIKINQTLIDSGKSNITLTSEAVLSESGDYIFPCTQINQQLNDYIIDENTTLVDSLSAVSLSFFESLFPGKNIDSVSAHAREMIVNQALLGDWDPTREAVTGSLTHNLSNMQSGTSPHKFDSNTGLLFQGLKSSILQLTTGASVTLGSLEARSAVELNNLMLLVIQMLFYAFCPIFFIFCGYKPKAALQILGAIVALEFMNVMFVMNVYIDEVISVAYQKISATTMNNGSITNASSVAHLVGMRFSQKMHVYSPFIYIGLMSFAGIKLGGVMNSAQAAVSSAASESAVMLQKVTSIITKGGKLGK